MNHQTRAFGLLLSFAGAALAQAPSDGGAVAALQKARHRAAVHNKRVLVALPAPGQDLAKMIQRDRSVSRTFRYEFELVQGDAKVFWPIERPALLVQDARGRILSHLEAGDFLAAGKLDGARLLEQVKPHFCAPADAEEKLAAAMAEAKKTGRNILIRFDAPW